MRKTAAGVMLLIGLSALAPLSAQGVNPYPSGNPTESAPLTASQLQALVAPIALYPDPLLAQVLTAATFPDQVAIADHWMQQNQNTHRAGSALRQAVDQQPWNASVKALSEFPSVLHTMATNLAWTSSIGEAFHGQRTAVMNGIQTLRARAKAAGNLTSNAHIKVAQESPQVILIQATNPQRVDVPHYDPALIFGARYVTPGYAPAEAGATTAMSFGAGVAVGTVAHGGCCPWGYSSWNVDWHGTAVLHQGAVYFGNPAWHGGYYLGCYHRSYGYGNAYSRDFTDFARSAASKTVGGEAGIDDRFSFSDLWAQTDGGASSAFSGFGGHRDADGGFAGPAGAGWASRAHSSRGWGSMRASGFAGGRFGGFGDSGGGHWDHH